MKRAALPPTHKPIVIIVGPTASGKTAASIRLAKKIHGAVISADSRQVYKGLNIGSGKVTKKEVAGVPHFCLDLVSPRTTYTAARFVKDATKALLAIEATGRIPIVCGGTGFYIDALTGRMPLASVPADSALRTKLAQKSPAILLKMLRALNPQKAETIDQRNKVRIIRAIEVARYEKKHGVSATTHHDALKNHTLIWVGIKKEKPELDKLIEKRLKKRWSKILQETSLLHAAGVSWKRLYDFGLEYRYASIALRGFMSPEQAYGELTKEIKHYAKRQMTWFKRNTEIKWVGSSQEVVDVAYRALKKADS